MRIFSYLFLLVLMFVGLTFASLNSSVVTFNYYLGTIDIVLSLLLVGAFGIGILFGLFTTMLFWIKVKHNNIQLKSRLKVVEKEVENLRSIPIRGD